MLPPTISNRGRECGAAPEKRTKGTGANEQQCAPIAVCPQDEIRERAYHNWENAGYPCSNGVEFWLQAEAQLVAESQPSIGK